MGEDLHAAPVPVRLSCRYSNGTVVSYVGRALSYDDSSLRVLSAENFEKGVLLNVLAPFMEGIVSCKVWTTSRSQEQTAYFELDLKVLKKLAPVRPPPQPKDTASLPIPEAVALTGLRFAARLENVGSLPFSQALQEYQPAERLMLLAICAPAVALLLQGEKLLDLKHLVEAFRKKG